MLLRNFDFSKKYFDYRTKNEVEDISDPKIIGWYKYINNDLSALLVIDNNLYFHCEDDLILVTNSHQVILRKIDKDVNEFIFVNGNEILFKYSYTLSDFRFNTSPFEYIDDEDGKWEEFLCRIINDREREKNFVKNLME